MVDFGHALSSEEHRPLDLVRNAVRPDQDGFFDLWERELRPQLS
jgi:hypothetical protein